MTNHTQICQTLDRKPLRYWSSNTANTPIHEGMTVQKPDIVLYDGGETLTDTWASVRVLCKHTTEENFPARQREAVFKRFRETFQHQYDRRFLCGILFSEYHYSYIHCDRMGVWGSGPLTLLDNLEVFYSIIAGCLYCSLTHIGYDPNIIYVMHKPIYINITYTHDLHSKFYYRILQVLFAAPGITGRGTVCYLAARGYKFFVIKELWQDLHQVTEYDHLINKVLPLNDPHLPRIMEGVFPYINDNFGVDYTNVSRPPSSYTVYNHAHVRFVLQPVGIKITDFCCKKELLCVFADVVKGECRQVYIESLH